MTVLFIDTSDSKKVTVRLRIGDKEFQKEQTISVQKAQAVLPLIVKLLKEQGLTLKHIEAIEVNRGPGSFTGLRVGITVASALSYALNVPINGQRPGSFVAPSYE